MSQRGPPPAGSTTQNLHEIRYNVCVKISPSVIALALTTSYPQWYSGKIRSIKHTDKIRGDLALEMITFALKQGYQVVAADWKSAKTFRKQLASIEGLHFIKRRSGKRSPSKRQALRKASKLEGVTILILTEPEKVSLLKDCLDTIIEPIIAGSADIVVPKRDDELFKKTYPTYMYESELEGNGIYNEELRSHELIEMKHEDYDMFFGPRVIANKKKIVSLFLQQYHFSIGNVSLPPSYFDVEGLSNATFFPVVRALKKNYRVVSVVVPFRYPALQKKNEEVGSRELFILKRKAQRISLIVELLHFVAHLEKYHNIRIKHVTN